jgi:hypothetical protein
MSGEQKIKLSVEVGGLQEALSTTRQKLVEKTLEIEILKSQIDADKKQTQQVFYLLHLSPPSFLQRKNELYCFS